MATGARSIRQERNPTGSQQKVPANGTDRLTPMRELQLVEDVRAGGPTAHRALSELVRGYQRRIYTICLRMVRNPDDASDLTQDALIKVIEGLDSYNGQSKLSTWVIRVTMNCCLSFLRKQKLRSHESLDGASHGYQASGKVSIPASEMGAASGAQTPFLDSGIGRELSPPQRIEQEQTRAMILTALDSLDADTRAILVLRDMQDLDYQQLAEVLDVPLGTVKSRLYRARAALRHAIETRSG